MGKAFQVGKQWGKGTEVVGSCFICRAYSLWEWEGIQLWGSHLADHLEAGWFL